MPIPVAALISASFKEFIITSNAAESDSISVRGVVPFHNAKKRHVIITQTEHKCIR